MIETEVEDRIAVLEWHVRVLKERVESLEAELKRRTEAFANTAEIAEKSFEAGLADKDTEIERLKLQAATLLRGIDAVQLDTVVPEDWHWLNAYADKLREAAK